MKNKTVKDYEKKIKKYEKDIRILQKWWNNYVKKVSPFTNRLIVTSDQVKNYNEYMQDRKDKIAFYTESIKKLVAKIYVVNK